MTENKRFAVTQTTLGSGIYDYQVENELCESYDEDAYGKVVRKLNELSEENKKLKEFQNKVFDLIDIKIEEANKKFQEYHPERENDVFLERYRTLKNLKEELEE